MKADDVVRARIPKKMKEKAVFALARIGLTASDLIRLTFLRVAEEERLPFELRVPRTSTKSHKDL